MTVKYLEIVTNELDSTCALYEQLYGEPFAPRDPTLGQARVAHKPDGTLIGKVHIPELVANVCFGGPKLNRLFICGTTSLYSIFLNVNGVSPV